MAESQAGWWPLALSLLGKPNDRSLGPNPYSHGYICILDGGGFCYAGEDEVSMFVISIALFHVGLALLGIILWIFHTEIREIKRKHQVEIEALKAQIAGRPRIVRVERQPFVFDLEEDA